MYKTEVIQRVAKQTRLSQHVVGDVLNASHRVIEETLRDGGTVTFPGFGTYATSTRQAGKVRDLRSGKIVAYPARRVAVFRIGAVLKRAVAGHKRRRGLFGGRRS